MRAQAIVYTSHTGSTAQYARLLGQAVGLPVYLLAQAQSTLPKGAAILYLGWVMAGSIKGYKRAAARYRVQAVCAVGMGSTGSQREATREKNAIPGQTEVFTLQGDLDKEKLHGLYRLLIGLLQKTAGKALAQKPDRTPEEDVLLVALMQGGRHIDEKNLQSVVDWYHEQEE